MNVNPKAKKDKVISQIKKAVSNQSVPLNELINTLVNGGLNAGKSLTEVL